MAILHSGESQADIELWTWDHTTSEEHPNVRGVFGRRPTIKLEYPKMMYRAQKQRNGQAACMAPAVSVYGWRDEAEYTRACLEADAFTRACQMIVHSQAEEARRLSEGWCESPVKALEEYEAQQKRYSDAAAEAAYAAQRMSPKAKAELQAADASTSDHVTDVVAAGKKRGRPKSRAVTA